MEWQMVGTDEWIYGRKVRGIVRAKLAEIYFDEDNDSPLGGWVWMLKNGPRGLAQNRIFAIEAAEEAMGVKSENAVPCPNCQANLLDMGTRTMGASTFCNRCSAEVTEAIMKLGPQGGTAVTKRKP